MDLSLPLTAISRRTDAAALQVLAAAGEPLTGRQVARLANESTPSNIRLSLLRLADVGLVIAAPRQDAVLYSANRDHLVWPAVASILNVREELVSRIRALTDKHASFGTTVILYGSVARRESDADSDVDLLVIQMESAINRDAYLDRLRDHVRKWTGNRVQIFDVTPQELRRMWRSKDPIVDAWRSDGRHVTGFSIDDHLSAEP